MIDPKNNNRAYTLATIQLVEPKSLHPPPEVQILIEEHLLTCNEEDFVNRLVEWTLIPYTYGHLNYKEMLRLFDRIDSSFIKFISQLKDLRMELLAPHKEGTMAEEESSNDQLKKYDEIEKLEMMIQDLLRGTINVLDIVKGVKYANLFKSIDILSDIFLYSEKLENIGLVLDIISIARTVIRKKNILVNYIGDKMPHIIWHVLNISKFYQFLNKDLKSLKSYQSTVEDL